MTANKNKSLRFGESLKELEDIVQWFEQEDVDLEEGIARFERGVELAKKCKARLKEVENKVTEIKAKFNDWESQGDIPEM
jgi:exodeoxyribonuclease VII small subunit